jgi:hypothetical protein
LNGATILNDIIAILQNFLNNYHQAKVSAPELFLYNTLFH